MIKERVVGSLTTTSLTDETCYNEEETPSEFSGPIIVFLKKKHSLENSDFSLLNTEPLLPPAAGTSQSSRLAQRQKLLSGNEEENRISNDRRYRLAVERGKDGILPPLERINQVIEKF